MATHRPDSQRVGTSGRVVHGEECRSRGHGEECIVSVHAYAGVVLILIGNAFASLILCYSSHSSHSVKESPRGLNIQHPTPNVQVGGDEEFRQNGRNGDVPSLDYGLRSDF